MGQKTKILTIDDEIFIRESLIAFLEDLDYEVYQAADGQEGLEVFRRERPDLVLSDLNMPILDGLGVLAVLKEESPQTPVIVISGAGDIQYAVDALKLGAWDYLIKPIVELATLEHAIKRALERVRLVQENEKYKKQLEETNRELEENLLVLRTDQEAGYRVQSGLLPVMHQEKAPLTFDLFFLPALYLSGDFADYVHLSPHLSCFYLADVSGHGVSSAFGTVLLKSLMDQYYTDFFSQKNDLVMDPSALLKKLGESFQKIQLGKYFTIFYGLIDLIDKKLTYSIGGQFPNPILQDASGSRYLEGRGFPIGVFKGATYENYTTDLNYPFNLFCFSDGILEIFEDRDLPAKEQYLLDLCRDPLLRLGDIDVKLGLSQLKKRLDDITLLQIRGQS